MASESFPASANGILNHKLAGEPRTRRSRGSGRSPSPALRAPHASATVCELAGIDSQGTPWVSFPETIGLADAPALSVVELTASDVGRRAAVIFEQGNAARPIIVGFIQPAIVEAQDAPLHRSVPLPIEVDADGERVTIVAERELVLRCGDASITLTKAGKLILRGAYLLSRSSGVNRIKGGSVQIN